MAAKRETRMITIATPEGAAYYPFGSWGRGYIVAKPMLAKLATYMRRAPWFGMPLWPVSSAIGRRLGVDEVVSVFGSCLVFCAILFGATLFVLRGCPKTATRVTSEDLLRRTLTERGALAAEWSWWCSLIIGAAVTFGTALTQQGLERLFFVGAELFWAVFALCRLWQIKRLDAARGAGHRDPRRRGQSPASRP